MFDLTHASLVNFFDAVVLGSMQRDFFSGKIDFDIESFRFLCFTIWQTSKRARDFQSCYASSRKFKINRMENWNFSELFLPQMWECAIRRHLRMLTRRWIRFNSSLKFDFPAPSSFPTEGKTIFHGKQLWQTGTLSSCNGPLQVATIFPLFSRTIWYVFIHSR